MSKASGSQRINGEEFAMSYLRPSSSMCFIYSNGLKTWPDLWKSKRVVWDLAVYHLHLALSSDIFAILASRQGLCFVPSRPSQHASRATTRHRCDAVVIRWCQTDVQTVVSCHCEVQHCAVGAVQAGATCAVIAGFALGRKLLQEGNRQNQSGKSSQNACC